jgi:hypothetical protein
VIPSGNPYRRLFQCFAALSPDLAGYNLELRKHALGDLLTPAELQALLEEVHAARPAALAEWSNGGRLGPVPGDDSISAWAKAAGIEKLFTQITLPTESRDEHFVRAWNLFRSFNDRQVIEALGLAHDAVKEFRYLLPGDNPHFSEPVLNLYFTQLHDHFGLYAEEKEEWVLRHERRAERSTVYFQEARAKRFALTFPREGEIILMNFRLYSRSLPMKSALRGVKRGLTARMFTESHGNPDSEAFRRMLILATVYEKLERIAPEPPEPCTQQPNRLMLSNTREALVTRAELLAAGELAEAAPKQQGTANSEHPGSGV